MLNNKEGNVKEMQTHFTELSVRVWHEEGEEDRI